MGSSWKRPCVEEPSYHDARSMGEHAFLAFTQSERNSLSKLDKFCQSTRLAGITLIAPPLFESETDGIIQTRLVEGRTTPEVADRTFVLLDSAPVVIVTHPR